jgi:hypothetical protein
MDMIGLGFHPKLGAYFEIREKSFELAAREHGH